MGWWYEVSRNEYKSARTNYGSNIYALDPRLSRSEDDSPSKLQEQPLSEERKAFTQGKVFSAPTGPTGTVVSSRSKERRKKNRAGQASGQAKAVKPIKQPSQKESRPIVHADSQKTHLPDPAKEFIWKRIMELGSVEGVQAVYSREDEVCRYARRIAPLIFRKKEGAQNPGNKTGPTVGGGATQSESVVAIKHLKERMGMILRGRQPTIGDYAIFQEVLEELRQIYRSDKNGFSDKDIKAIQRMKEEFERVTEGVIG